MAEYIELESAARLLESVGAPAYAVHALVLAKATDVALVAHGRWEPQEYWKYEKKHSILYKTNRCSLCHFDVSSRLLYNYCPNCGARMDGEP